MDFADGTSQDVPEESDLICYLDNKKIDLEFESERKYEDAENKSCSCEAEMITISTEFCNTEKVTCTDVLKKMIHEEFSVNEISEDYLLIDNYAKNVDKDTDYQSSEDEYVKKDYVYLTSEEEEEQEEYDDSLELYMEDEKLSTNSGDSDKENISFSKQESKKLTRKRLRRPENWRRNVRKKAAGLGQEYVSATANKTVKARSMKSSCGPGCRFKCENKLTEVERSSFFAKYWSIEEHSRKYDFIVRHVKETPNKENIFNEPSKRNYSRIYTIGTEQEKKIEVCQTMFCNTLDISRQVINSALKKIRNGDTQLIDKRGSSKNRPRTINEKVTEGVKEHINMFPRVESHYCRKDSTREYLEENLNYATMYKLYLQWSKENDKPKATLNHYKSIFNSEFNLGFFKPKKDQCDSCEAYKNATENKKPELDNKHESHLRNKEISRKLKDDDKIYAKSNQNDTIMACFDFQKVLSTPQTEASCLYYKRKLSVYNFTVYDVIHHEGICYIWSESEAKKGSNEVASCLFKYIERKSQAGITNFLFWSDNCAGQNRNSNVFSMYVLASAKFLVNIKHSFLEVGHTQNEGDSVHACIERYARGRKIYTQNEWCQIIQNAKQIQPQYEICTVTFDIIYDFKDLSSKLNWKKTIVKKNKTAAVVIGISKIKQVHVSCDKQNQLQYKTDFEKDYETVVTRKEKGHVNVKKYKLTKAYNGAQGITAVKKKDLSDLCNSLIIPEKYHAYYSTLPVKSSTNVIADEDDCE